MQIGSFQTFAQQQKRGGERQKGKEKKKGKGSVCHGEADKFVEGKIHFRAPEWESQTKVNP